MFVGYADVGTGIARVIGLMALPLASALISQRMRLVTATPMAHRFGGKHVRMGNVATTRAQPAPGPGTSMRSSTSGRRICTVRHCCGPVPGAIACSIRATETWRVGVHG